MPENWNSDENPFNSDTEETAVKDGYYFIIGDNRELFPDSRSSGLVSSELIKGKGAEFSILELCSSADFYKLRITYFNIRAEFFSKEI